MCRASANASGLASDSKNITRARSRVLSAFKATSKKMVWGVKKKNNVVRKKKITLPGKIKK